MELDPKITKLINADIDGALPDSEKRELDSILARDMQARTYHAEVSRICTAMDSAEMLDPPPHLRHVIMALIKPKRSQSDQTGFLARFFSAPVLRFAGVFAAGVVLALAWVGSDVMSGNTIEDVTGLVGTMSDVGHQSPADAGISISQDDVTGTISAHKSGRIVVIDFDLVSSGPMEIVAGFNDENAWFNGFAQLESSGASVSASPGRIAIQTEGKRRFALYLNDSGDTLASVDLQFVSAGRVVHEVQLPTGPGGS
jgi:hypothetical protein